MYFYFFCPFPAVIKFQGVIFGTVDNSVKFCNFEKPYPLTEICPLMGKGQSFAFYFDEKFLNAPPENISITDLKGGYFLRFSETEKSSGFSVINQAKFRDCTITAFTENGSKVSFETQTGFFAETLSFTPASAEFTHGEGVNSNLVFAVFGCADKKILNVYGIKENALLLSAETDEFDITYTGFNCTERLKDIAKHEILREYAYGSGTVKELSRKVGASDGFDCGKLPERLIPYTFSEEFLCGGDYGFYLAENVKENADKLGGYLGDYIGITPPPIFRKSDEIGFIYKLAERKYSVDYFIFVLSGGKITNIKKT